MDDGEGQDEASTAPVSGTSTAGRAGLHTVGSTARPALRERGPRRWRRYRAPIGSFVFVVVALTAFLAMYTDLGPFDGRLSAAVRERPDVDVASAVGDREWQIWVTLVALGIGAFAILLVRGATELSRAPAELRVTVPEVVLHVAAAVAFVLAIGALSVMTSSDGRDWPAGLDIEWRMQLVVGSGLLCAVPWVALTWLTHQATIDYRVAEAHTPGGREPTPEEWVRRLLDVWDRLTTYTLSFSVFVVVALVPTGALRNLWLSQTGPDGPTSAELEQLYPPTDVLLYGGFFVLLSAVLVVPMVFSWRAAAREVLEVHCEATVARAKDSAAWAERERVEKLLHLDSTLIRNPLTLMSVFTPLITSALAAFVPELAGS